MKLRDYQQKAVAAVQDHWSRVDSTLVVLPTGCGKTEVFVRIAADFEGRSLVVAPTIELVDQAAEKLRKRTGITPAIEQAHRTSNEWSSMRSPFVCASKQTLLAQRGGRRRFERLQDIGLVIVDEAHLAATKQYGDLLDHFRARGAKVLGVTATPKRADGVALGTLFETVAYQQWIPDAIADGWLVAPHAVCCQVESLDLSEVGTKGARGDFKDGELAKAMEREETVFEIAEITARESVVDGRTLKTVVYCATVAEAQAVAERLVDRHGLRADWVCGDKKLCPPDRRQSVLKDFADPASPLTHVCNVGVLTTGWDCPTLEHIVAGRPTKSVALYTQILGRGTRPLPGVVDFEGSTPESRRAAIAASAKPHFKVTDLCDNTLQHRLAGVCDVLGGRHELVESSGGKKSVEDVAAEEVARQLRDGETIDVVAAMAVARAAEEKRRAEAEEARRRRQRVASEARYQRVEADPLAPGTDGAARSRKSEGYAMPFGKHKGTPVADLPTAYIKRLLNFSADPSSDFKLFAALEWRLKSELHTREAAQTAPAPWTPPVPVAKAEPAPWEPAAPTTHQTYKSLADRMYEQLELLGVR